MRKPLTDEDLLVRAAIDGRVAFATAAFATAAGLVALLDRVGAPPALVSVLGPAMTLIGLATVGLLMRTMRISRFYAGGRAAPAAYAGFAFASLAAGLFLPFLPPIAGGPPFGFLLGSFSGGFVMAALVCGPLLRRTGAFSVPDLVADRFPNLALRLGVVAVIAACGLLVAAAGYETATEALARAVGLERATAALIIALTLVFVLAPGGVAGVVWASAGAAGVFLAGLGLPILILYTRGVTPALPVGGDVEAWGAALARMSAWNAEAGGGAPAGVGVMVAIVIGIGALAPLFMPAICTGDRHAARGAGLAGLFWCLVFAIFAAASMALSALALDMATIGMRPELLPGAIMAASKAGFIDICGGHPATAAAARAACAARSGFSGTLGADDIMTGGRFLLLGLSDLGSLGGAFSGLASAGVVAISISVAAAGFQTFATAVGHDAFYRVRDATAMTSRRLAVTRLLLILAIAAGGVLAARGGPDPRGLIGLAIVFCAATIAPLLALSIWPRAEGTDAAVALLAGLATTEAMIWWNGGVGSLDGVGAAAVFACAVSVSTGFIGSFLHPHDPTARGGAFVQGMLRGDGELLHPDKGA